MSLHQIVRVSVLLVASSLGVPAQRANRAAKATTAPSSLPAKLLVCEGETCRSDAVSSSTMWNFSGLEGVGHDSAGNQALTIQHLDRDSIVIRRRGAVNAHEGTVALYIGAIDGDQIVGTVTYEATQGSRARTALWSGKIEDFGSRAPAALKIKEQHSSSPIQRIVECEGPDCSSSGYYPSVWTFEGAIGTGQFPTGDQPLVVQHYDQNLIIVRREETSGPLAGTTALYLGTIIGKRITGSVRFEPKTLKAFAVPWYGAIENPQAFVPEVIVNSDKISVPAHIMACQGTQACDAFWTFEGVNGEGIWPKTGFHADFKVERFDPQEVSIIAVKTSLPGITGSYTGKLHGNKIVGNSVP